MLNKMNAEVFLKVAELGSYRRAADELGYTQAGITYIINTMEEDAGLKLFAREYGGVKLTADGQQLLPWVKQLANCGRALSERAEELRTLHAGKVRVVCFNSFMVYWLPNIIEGFHKKYQDIEIELVSCDRFDEIEDSIYNRDVDCGFLLLPAKADLEVFTLSEEQMMVAFSQEHPFSGRKRLSFADLARSQYIGPPLEYDPGIRSYFDQNHFVPAIGFTTENDAAAMAMASRGLGYCIYPKFMLEQSSFPLSVAELQEPLYWTFGIGTRSLDTCSAAAKAFINHTIDSVKNR